MTNDIVPVQGSLSQHHGSTMPDIAELFASDVEAILVVDISASMSEMDDGVQTRWERANQELSKVQAAYPGRVAVVEFSTTPNFIPDGVLSEPHGSTRMSEALAYIHVADGYFKIILISDGEPDSENRTLDVARKYRSPIDTIYIGPENGDGLAFLNKLAKTTGGTSQKCFNVQSLGDGIIKLLTGGK